MNWNELVSQQIRMEKEARRLVREYANASDRWWTLGAHTDEQKALGVEVDRLFAAAYEAVDEAARLYDLRRQAPEGALAPVLSYLGDERPTMDSVCAEVFGLDR